MISQTLFENPFFPGHKCFTGVLIDYILATVWVASEGPGSNIHLASDIVKLVALSLDIINALRVHLNVLQSTHKHSQNWLSVGRSCEKYRR